MKNLKTGFTTAQGATHEDLLPSKAKGFTLAEVLITLGIIGVVAAMTIPTLIANTRSQQYRSQFKKTLSTLNQAARMAQAQYDFDFGSLDGPYISYNTCGTEDPIKDKSMCALLNGTLTGYSYKQTPFDVNREYAREVRKATGTAFNSDYLVYSLADGAFVIFPFWVPDATNVMKNCTKNNYQGHNGCLGFIDVNGISKPNKEVLCSDGFFERKDAAGYGQCQVDNASIGDIFPVFFHDETVEPATNAAEYVLNTAK